MPQAAKGREAVERAKASFPERDKGAMPLFHSNPELSFISSRHITSYNELEPRIGSSTLVG